MLGAAFAAAAPGIPSWDSGFDDGNNVGGPLAAVLSPAGGFGKFLLVLIALSTSCTCAPTMYSFGQFILFESALLFPLTVFILAHFLSAGMSLMAVGTFFARIPRYVLAIISEAMCVCLIITIRN